MPRKQKKGGRKDEKWIEKPSSSKTDGPSTEAITVGISGLIIGENSAQPAVPVPQFGSISMDEISHLHGQTSGQSHASLVSSPMINGSPLHGKKAVYQPKSYGTVSGATIDAPKPTANAAALSKLLKGNLLENFTVDNSTYSTAKIRATFYPKFENEKSDQEVRIRMIEMVSKGLATLEVSLKHSGSLFMYAGHEGGAYAKNSFGNVYTAVGVFVLGRIFREAWGTEASKKTSRV